MKKKYMAFLLAVIFVLSNIAPTLALEEATAVGTHDAALALDEKKEDESENQLSEEKQGDPSPDGKQEIPSPINEEIATAGEGAADAPEEEALSEEEATQQNDEYGFIGYQEGGSELTRKLYVEKKDDPSVRRIVYCFNKSLHWPDTKNTTNELAYKKTTGSVDDFEGKVHAESKYKGQELIDKLKIVLLNGYPNANKIQNALKLTNDQMQKVTQIAVWHFTDKPYTNLGQFSSLDDTEALAIALLINMADYESVFEENILNHFESIYKDSNPNYLRPESVEMPENSTLDLYIQNDTKQADGKGYQNLLGAFLVNPDTKEIIDIPKDEPGKDRKKSWSCQN